MTEKNVRETIETDLEKLRQASSSKANMSLFGLFLVFGLSISFFLFSDSLFSLGNTNDAESEGIEMLNRQSVEFKLELVTTEASLDKAQRLISINNGKIQAIRERLAMDVVAEALADSMIRNEAELMEEQVNNENDVATHTHARDVLRGKLSVVESELGERDKLDTNSKQIESVIATTITRFGAVMLAVFMMQILLTFFRYYTKLASFYSTRKVALRYIQPDDANALQSFATTLSVSEFDFGKNPELSMDKIIEIVKLSK